MTVQTKNQTSPADELIEALDELSLQVCLALQQEKPWDALEAPPGSAVDESFERLRAALTAYRRQGDRNGLYRLA